MAAAPSGDLPVQAVRLKMAKRPRKVRQPDPNTHRPLQCPHPGCGKWFKGPRLLDRHFKGHEGLADGECLKCGREFNFVTALRYHCKHRCGPESLPKRHIPQKGKEALEWAALLAPAAELEQLLDGDRGGGAAAAEYCAAAAVRGADGADAGGGAAATTTATPPP